MKPPETVRVITLTVTPHSPVVCGGCCQYLQITRGGKNLWWPENAGHFVIVLYCGQGHHLVRTTGICHECGPEKYFYHVGGYQFGTPPAATGTANSCWHLARSCGSCEEAIHMWMHAIYADKLSRRRNICWRDLLGYHVLITAGAYASWE